MLPRCLVLSEDPKNQLRRNMTQRGDSQETMPRSSLVSSLVSGLGLGPPATPQFHLHIHSGEVLINKASIHCIRRAPHMAPHDSG